jgi:hypothetical protein
VPVVSPPRARVRHRQGGVVRSREGLPATSYVTMTPGEAERLWKIEALVRRHWQEWVDRHGGDRDKAYEAFGMKGREVIDLLEAKDT